MKLTFLRSLFRGKYAAEKIDVKDGFAEYPAEPFAKNYQMQAAL